MLTIENAIDACKQEMKTTIKSANTTRAYHKGLDVFIEFLSDEYRLKPDADLSALNVEMFVRFPVWLLQESPTIKTAIVRGSAVKWFLDKWLVQYRHLEPTYADGIRLKTAMRNVFRKSGKLSVRKPEDGDIEKAIAAARSMTDKEPGRSLRIAVASFLAVTGLRVQELVDLKCIDLKMAKFEVVVRAGKGDKERIVPFSSQAAADVQDYWAVRGWSHRDDPAFANHSNRVKPGRRVPLSTNAARNIIQTLRKIGGIEGELTPHYFRHYFASRVLRETGNIKLVSELLGHSDISVTEIYIHMDTTDKHKGYDKAFGEE